MNKIFPITQSSNDFTIAKKVIQDELAINDGMVNKTDLAERCVSVINPDSNLDERQMKSLETHFRNVVGKALKSVVSHPKVTDPNQLDILHENGIHDYYPIEGGSGVEVPVMQLTLEQMDWNIEQARLKQRGYGREANLQQAFRDFLVENNYFKKDGTPRVGFNHKRLEEFKG